MSFSFQPWRLARIEKDILPMCTRRGLLESSRTL
jgi:hypothetical protein